MGRHVVGAFHAVEIRGVTVGRQAADKVLQIAAHVRIGIFRDQQRGAGVTQKCVADSGIQAALANQRLQFPADFLETPSGC